MKKQFTAYLLNEEGEEQERNGLCTHDDKYGHFASVLIEVDEIELVMPVANIVRGLAVVRIGLKSGMSILVSESVQEIKKIIYAGVIQFNN